MNNWFNQEAHEVIKAFASNLTQGLGNHEVQQRLAKYGANQLQTKEHISPWRIFWAQFTDFMVLVLLGAALVSGILGEKADAVTIILIVIINALLGFFQEYRAEKSLEALKELTAPQASVLREGLIKRISAQELVPGDILILESGDRIAADGRLCETVDLEINEATLTGESLSVQKNSNRISKARPVLGDQTNMVFAGTIVANGRGRAIVISSGMQTEIGKIAGMIADSQTDETPLQKRLTELGRWLVFLCLAICAAVGTIGILRGEAPREMFLAAVSLAVAAIPEGLPAIVTIALALGVQRMIKRKAIIRKLPAVETLGCATVICSDKTGTLTQNKLEVTRLWTGTCDYQAQSKGELSQDLRQLLEVGVLCNNAQLNEKKFGKREIVGDPTEGALLLAAVNFGLNPGKLIQQKVRLGELPFTSERKRMSVWVKTDQGRVLMLKGAADIILDRCNRIVTANGNLALDSHWREVVKERLEEWGNQALRVLAFAYRPEELGEITTEPEKNLILLGLMGMSDPPRPEVRQAIAKSRQAGIQVKMITGDYPKTAASIAAQIGLLRSKGQIMTGTEIDQLSDLELAKVIKKVDVFARVDPHHKLRVVRALRANHEIVAMTGDGVNDAPAIKEADIGVAMGLSGTDVTKEAAAMVIADDNFATIVAAIEEGRTIYDNIRKFIRYLLSCNMGEILTMFGGLLVGLPMPLLPIQILWVNLVTDGLPAIALGMDAPESGSMMRAPRPTREGIFSRGLGGKIFLQGLMIGGATLLVYLLKIKNGGNLMEARTAAFAALVFAQLFFVFQCRSEENSMFQLKAKPNFYLIGAVLVSSVMQILVMTFAPLQKIFYTTNLNLNDWSLILGINLGMTLISDLLCQLQKILKRHFAIFNFVTHRVRSFVEK